MSSIVLFEPDFHGHRLSHCAMLIEYCLDNGLAVQLATTADAVMSEEYAMFLQHMAHGFEIIDLEELPVATSPNFLKWAAGKLDEVRQQNPDAHIYVLEGDKLLPRLTLKRNVVGQQLTVLMIRPPVTLGGTWRNALNAVGKLIASLVCMGKGIDVVTIIPATAVSDRYSIGPWRGAPDPVDFVATPATISAYKKSVGLSSDRFWIGIFGNIVQRKNLDVALGAATLANPSSLGFIIAGKISDAERERCSASIRAFEKAGGIVRTDDRLLTDLELDSAIGAADVAMFAHSGDGPSQIFGKAIVAGTRVVTAGPKVLRREVQRHSRGVWCKLNAEEIAGLIEGLRGTQRAAPIALAGRRQFAKALLQQDRKRT